MKQVKPSKKVIVQENILVGLLTGLMIGVMAFLKELGKKWSESASKKVKDKVDALKSDWAGLSDKDIAVQCIAIFNEKISDFCKGYFSDASKYVQQKNPGHYQKELTNLPNTGGYTMVSSDTTATYTFNSGLFKPVERDIQKVSYQFTIHADLTKNSVTVSSTNSDLNSKIQGIMNEAGFQYLKFTYIVGLPFDWKYTGRKANKKITQKKNENLELAIENVIIEHHNKITKLFEADKTTPDKNIDENEIKSISQKIQNLISKLVSQSKAVSEEEQTQYNDMIKKISDDKGFVDKDLKNFEDAEPTQKTALLDRFNTIKQYANMTEEDFIKKYITDAETETDTKEEKEKEKEKEPEADTNEINKHMGAFAKALDFICSDIVQFMILPIHLVSDDSVTAVEGYEKDEKKSYFFQPQKNETPEGESETPPQKINIIFPLMDETTDTKYFILMNDVDRTNPNINYINNPNAKLFQGTPPKGQLVKSLQVSTEAGQKFDVVDGVLKPSAKK